MIIQALIWTNERNNIHGKYLTNNGARIAMPTVEWKNGNHNSLIKPGSDDLNKKIIDPSLV
jgi:DNA-binding cell septation regulator SpoVG